MENKGIKIAVKNGGVTKEQIADWKQAHGRVSEISIIEDGINYTGYFKRPSMETISAVNKVSKTDELKGAETLLKNCWLGGELAIKNDAILALAATTQLGSLMNSCVGSIKNL